MKWFEQPYREGKLEDNGKGFAMFEQQGQLDGHTQDHDAAFKDLGLDDGEDPAEESVQGAEDVPVSPKSAPFDFGDEEPASVGGPEDPAHPENDAENPDHPDVPDAGAEGPDVPDAGAEGPDHPDVPDAGAEGPDHPDVPDAGAQGPDVPDAGAQGPDHPDVPDAGAQGPEHPEPAHEGQLAHSLHPYSADHPYFAGGWDKNEGPEDDGPGVGGGGVAPVVGVAGGESGFKANPRGHHFGHPRPPRVPARERHAAFDGPSSGRGIDPRDPRRGGRVDPRDPRQRMGGSSGEPQNRRRTRASGGERRGERRRQSGRPPGGRRRRSSSPRKRRRSIPGVDGESSESSQGEKSSGDEEDEDEDEDEDEEDGGEEDEDKDEDKKE